MAKQKEATFKKDLIGSIIIGFAAALLSLIVIKNLEIKISFIYPFLVFPFLTIAGIFFGRFIGKKIPILYKFVKFGEAGGLNWLVDFGVLNMLIMLTSISTGIFYSVFKGISFVVATFNSYFWNRMWVFESKNKDTTKEIFKFLIITLIGLGINVATASLIVFFGPKLTVLEPKIWANIGAAVGSLVAMGWNFIMYKFWVFKK